VTEPLRTQSQKYLAITAQRIYEIKDEPWKRIYGGLCHSFPILVRVAGLAQAVQFHRSKGAGSENGSDRQKAHWRLLCDIDDLLPDFDIEKASLMEYMWATRRVQAAWVFYKRFASSVLKVETGDQDAETT